MHRVFGRVLGAGAGVVVLLAGAALAIAAAPAGPQLAAIQLSAKPPRVELVTVTPSGDGAVRLAGGGRSSPPWLSPLMTVAWSPDGETVAFSGIVGAKQGDDHEPIRRIFTVRADGSGLRAVRGTDGGAAPVFSPDGRTLAFTRAVERDTPTTVGGKRWKDGFEGASIWIVDLETGRQRQLTPWKDEQRYIASSFSPDGMTLLGSREDERLLQEAEPVALQVDGSGSRRLFADGGSPVFSPDGSRIAFVRSTGREGEIEEESSDLWMLNADGSGVRRITRSPGAELLPSWDPSGERLAYLRFSVTEDEEEGVEIAVALMQINADGSCPTRVIPARRTELLAAAWRPGPGRGAGRIEC